MQVIKKKKPYTIEPLIPAGINFVIYIFITEII